MIGNEYDVGTWDFWGGRDFKEEIGLAHFLLIPLYGPTTTSCEVTCRSNLLKTRSLYAPDHLIGDTRNVHPSVYEQGELSMQESSYHTFKEHVSLTECSRKRKNAIESVPGRMSADGQDRSSSSLTSQSCPLGGGNMFTHHLPKSMP